MMLKNIKVGILGLGYVGLPLAVEFAKHFEVIGFDISKDRIDSLNAGFDKTQEISSNELKKITQIKFTSLINDLSTCNFYIVTVPTPISADKIPDLQPLIDASYSVSSVLQKGNFVVYESTVYPGATEEDCAPILEKESGLKLNKDFFLGYSPERINPGDKNHKVKDIIKVVSGSSDLAAETINAVYSTVISAGTYLAPSIKVAEAAKVIENTQRDLNIALINELALIFEKLEIDTEDVLKAAETKWNFLPFRPGLVGGHCIGVDPYYLTQKAQSVGYNPEIILAGRRLNDGMGDYVAQQLKYAMLQEDIDCNGSKVLILGLTFKENCPDTRNSQIPNTVISLKSFGANVDIYDPYVEDASIEGEKFNLVKKLLPNTYDGIVIAVKHKQFEDLGIEKIRSFAKAKSVIYDLKYMFDKTKTDLRL